MLRKIIRVLVVALPLMASAQSSYNEDMPDYRRAYMQSLLRGGHPLKHEDIAYLRFYDVDPAYRVKAFFVIVTGKKPFLMRTMHGGKSKAVRTYGYVYFNLMGASLKLYVYRFLDMQNNADLNDRLFIPFTDRTNYKETFQGGRYLDLSIDDIKDGRVIIDFNKCYNPHTAYQMGYPYLVPPRVNSLRIDIKAGEKIFGHNPGY